MSGKAIPVIDLGPYRTGTPQEREAVARQWDDAFRKVGFAAVVGHGVSSGVIEGLYDSALSFFKLPLEEKLHYCLNKGYGHGGYVPVGVEAVGRSRGDTTLPPDVVENMVFNSAGDERDAVPEEPPQFRSAVQEYWRAMQDLLQLLLEISAQALSLPRDHFTPSYGPTACKCNLRLAHYPPQQTPPAPGQLRYGAHTDYTGFTILRQDDCPGGLEVLMGDEWVPVPPLAGSFVINAGDLIQQWTNDRWLSNLHRVTNPPIGLDRSRLSLVFFTGPHDDTLVTPLSTCCSDENPSKYPPVRSGEHLRRKLGLTNT
eukprot:comp60925_c0_seq1/m.47878 comp60925_c0_seq1/g.47878  ORF comp60925_c0_seq1/g.47878 comp60925_c0_seq1/m.47878 type:complete len:314 (-) comp60925_c0_seq1:562-1503(-)